MPKRPTMADIALAAGVSQATVSLVLNGVVNARVSAETRARVEALARDLGYTRKAAVARGGARVVGLLIDEVVTTPFAAPFVEGARLEAAAQGAVVLTCCTGGDPAQEAAAVDALRGTNLAGLLYTTLMTRSVTLPDALTGLPAVLLNCHAPGASLASVVPGDVVAGMTATERLIRDGHRRIAHIAGETWGEAARDRALGYRRALAAADIPFVPDLLAGPAWTASSGREMALRLLSLPEPPTAIFCFNDRVALGVYEAAAQLGRRIPDDLSVVGFDDDDIAATLNPPLTTLVLPHDEMARWAVERLLTQPDAAPRRLKVDCDLVERGSVAPPAGLPQRQN